MGGTSDLDFGHIEGTIGEYVQPWEVFRGWTPRGSYGQNSPDLNANQKSTTVYLNNEKNISIKKAAKSERTES